MGYPTDEDFRTQKGPSPREVRMARDTQIRNIIAETEKEVLRSYDLGFGNFNSAHEGYAVILEELDELKAHVWMNQKKRDLAAMRKEAIQTAAMCVKFVESLDEGNGRV